MLGCDPKKVGAFATCQKRLLGLGNVESGYCGFDDSRDQRFEVVSTLNFFWRSGLIQRHSNSLRFCARGSVVASLGIKID
jgi:hypothetical protein